MSKIKQYQSFVAVVEEGGITNAAARLNLSVPAISKQLVQLEEGLKVQLFHRSHKKIEITDAGKKFYPKCKSILNSIHIAEDNIVSVKEAMQGTISITISKSLCRSKIIDVFSEFSSIYPKIDLHIHFSEELEDLLSKDIDIAFRLGKQYNSATLVATLLLETKLIAFATPEYLERHIGPSSFQNPKKSKFIMMSNMSPNGELKQFLNKQKFDFKRSVAHTTNDVEGVYRLTELGLGVGMLLDISIEKELKEGKFVQVLPDSKLPQKSLFLISKKVDWQTTRVKVFKEFIVSKLA